MFSLRGVCFHPGGSVLEGGGPLEIKILSFAADQLLKIKFLIKKVSFTADLLLLLVEKSKMSNITADLLLLLLKI